MRFYGAALDRMFLHKGGRFEDLPETYIIFISKNDFLKQGQTVYRVEKTINGMPYDDGMNYYFVNAAVDDGSKVSRLMEYFKTADSNDRSFDALSEVVADVKSVKGAERIMDRLFKEMEEKFMQQAEARAKEEGRKETLVGMVRRAMEAGMTFEEALNTPLMDKEDRVRTRLAKSPRPAKLSSRSA